MLIEDEETSREIARITLNRMGIADIAFADDGEHALHLLDTMDSPPDVVITDVFMPNKDGIELVNALVTRRFAGGLILLTGADPAILHIARTMAVSGGLNLLAALMKPLNEQALSLAFGSLHRN
jgi:YesN/AraC family two-component response regulator